MNRKKRFILASLGALSLFNVVTNGMANEQHFIKQPLNIGMPMTPVNNIGMNQKVLNSNGQQQQKQKGSNAVAYVAAGTAGGVAGFFGGSLFQYLLDQRNATAQENHITSLNEQIKNNENEIDKLKNGGNNSEDKIKKLEKENHELTEEIGQLKSKINMLENNDDSAKKIHDLQAEVKKCYDGLRGSLSNIKFIRDTCYLMAKEQKSPHMALLYFGLDKALTEHNSLLDIPISLGRLSRGSTDTDSDGGFFQKDAAKFGARFSIFSSDKIRQLNYNSLNPNDTKKEILEALPKE